MSPAGRRLVRLPALSTAHSHAFQRAMRGTAQRRGVDPKDDFWTWRGQMYAVAGSLTPGGPATSFPFVVALYMAGADRGSLVAYLTAWSLLGFQRVVVWEMPFLGIDFVWVRLLANLPFPILAGIIARKLPGIAAREVEEKGFDRG